MRYFIILCLWLAGVCGPAAGQQADTTRLLRTDSSLKKKTIVKTMYGIASFYSDFFDGRETANGEIYRKNKFTAACNVLPLGTWIRVTNLTNNKSVIVKTNDRLHARMKRIVDLSRVAAEQLGFTARGLTRVRVEVLADVKKR